MGILNVTPDSFSDGGRFLEPGAAADHALRMAAEGADLIDIGAESTRPGSHPVPPAEQLRRMLPVLREARRRGLVLPVSIDTQSAEVAAAGLSEGADMVNDVSGGRSDPAMPALLADWAVPFVVMHMQGTPATMQADPRYADVVGEVEVFFIEREAALARAGVDTSRMIVDPGLGFGKRLAHNLELLWNTGRFARRWPVLVGPSRKRFIAEVQALGEPGSGANEPGGRVFGTAAAVAMCVLGGASIVRVHDVGAMRRVVEVCEAARCAGQPGGVDAGTAR
jgi:dihydropteroate synthase